MRKFLLLFFLVVSLTGAAQNAIIRGAVKNSQGVLAKASVTLLGADGKQVVKITAADVSGVYEFENVAEGSYQVQATNVGYAAAKSKIFEVKTGATIIVDDIVLTVSTKANDAAVVTAKKKPLIEVKADKMILNVESSINAIGSNAFELLRKSPGVVIDKDDNLQLKGKNGVRIFIDGKPTVFDAKDLAEYLKTINSADIESIEFITNPSARYEAEGNAGIINIRLKKSKKLGYNGSASAGFAQQIFPKVNGSLNMNYRKNKINLFGNYSVNSGNNWGSFRLDRTTTDSTYFQKTTMENYNTSHNIKMGMDYSASRNSTYGVLVTGNWSDGTGNSTSATPIANKFNNVQNSTLFASNESVAQRNNYNVNLNYRYTDSNSVEVAVDADKGWFRNDAFSFQPNEYRYTNNLTNPVFKIYRNLTPTDIDINSFKVDVGFPLAKGKLELGGKYSNVQTENASDFYNVVNGVDILDANLTNRFTYREKINALYANFSKQANQKLNYQLGVRMENTESEGDLVGYTSTNDANVKRSYTDLFPSAALSYTINMKNSLNLTYSRRIDRPGYQDLNPFESRLDELTFQKGNAFLKPQYSHVVELTHTYKYMYNTSLSFTRVNDFTTQFVDSAANNKSFITQRNLGVQTVAGINFSAPVQFKKWWSFFGNINLNYIQNKADLPDGRIVNLDATSGSFFGQNTFILKKGFTAEVSGFYALPGIWGGTFKSAGLGGMDLGLGFPIFGTKGNVKMSLTDVFKTMRWKGTNVLPGAYMVASGRWESQQFKMNFTYRFGNSQIKANSTKKTGIEKETERAKKSSGGIGG
jgi:hypothetical protein